MIEKSTKSEEFSMKDTFMPKLITILSGLAAVYYLWTLYGVSIGALNPGNGPVKYLICYGLSQAMMIFGIVMWRRVVKSKKEQ